MNGNDKSSQRPSREPPRQAPPSHELRVWKCRLGRQLGSGSFGLVFDGRHVETGQPVAIKLEPRDAPHKQVAWEYRTYRRVAGPLVPEVFYYGEQDDYMALVMERLGPSLQHFVHRQPAGRLRTSPDPGPGLRTLSALALQMLARVQHIHLHGVIHRDLKPENFVFGRGRHKTDLYLIDYGLCRVQTVGAPDPGGSRNLIGTVRYASLRNHRGQEQSFGDDLESLVYVWAFLYHGHLPWQGLPHKTRREQYRRIYRVKRDLPPQDWLGADLAPLEALLRYAQNLPYGHLPDYEQAARHIHALTG